MSNYSGAFNFPAQVYQFEESDVVKGGPDGIDNVPLTQLSDRTFYLKALADFTFLNLFNLNPLGSFKEGFQINSAGYAVFDEASGKWLKWTGSLPKVVAKSSKPETTGGIYDPVTNPTGKWKILSTSKELHYAGQNILEQWRRSLAEAGLTLVDGSFEEGASVQNDKQAVWHIAGGQCYVWGGDSSTLPKVVPAGSTPATTGGVGVGAWVSVGDLALRQELISPGGGNIPGWYDAPSSVRASNHKTPSNSWQDAINSARIASGANSPIIIGANATGAETVPVQYGLPSGVSGYHLSQGTSEAPSTDKRPLILLEKVCDSLDSAGPHTMVNYSMKYVGGEKGAIPLSSYVEASGTAEGGAIGIHTRAKTTVETASGWGGWSYIDVQSVLPVRAIGHEINVRCNIPNPLTWSASGGEVDGLVVATVDNGSNNMAHSAIKVSRSSQGLGFLSGLRFGYRSIVPSDTSDMTKLNGEAILINGGSSNAERYGGIRIGADDGFGFTRFHYGLRTNEAEFNNNVAIWLGDNHRIRWGAQLSSGPYLHYNATDFEFVGAALNVVNGLGSSLKLNNVKVLGPRVTGLFAMTGTADGTAKNTETITLQELARYVKKFADAAIAHGFVGPT